MAVPEDYIVYQRAWSSWAELCPTTDKVIVCSGNKEQLAIVISLFPVAKVLNWDINQWDLNRPCPTSADIIVACNVFQYSPNPQVWFKNCFASCKYLWVQDLFSRPRGPDGTELSKNDPTDDRVRYGFGGVFSSNTDTMFDLAVYRDRLRAIGFYDAGSFKEGKALINFAACLRGDLPL
jgi:hypothetical protein